jgi:hypothetical protein
MAAEAKKLDFETDAIAEILAKFKQARGVNETKEGARSRLGSHQWNCGPEIVASCYADSFSRDDLQPPYPARAFHWGLYSKAPDHLHVECLTANLVGCPKWALGSWMVTGAPVARARLESGPNIASAQRQGRTIKYVDASHLGKAST